jgi:hypothetical protein
MADSARSLASSLAYRQQARQLRARLRNQPAALHRALSALNGSIVEFKDESERAPMPRRHPGGVGGKPAAAASSLLAPPHTTALPPAVRNASSGSSDMVWALTTNRPTFDLAIASPRLRLVDPDRVETPPRRRIPAGPLEPVTPRRPAPPADPTGAIERGFAAAVEQRLHSGVLRCDDRAALLRAADRLRLDRFRANLIIALVQRAADTGRSAVDGMAIAPAAAAMPSEVQLPRPIARVATWVLVAALIEAALAAAAWHAWF